MVVPRSAGLSYPLFADGTLDFGPAIWKPLDELLDGWPPKGAVADLTEQKAVYDAEIAGRLLAEPVERAARWFTRLQDAGWRR